MAWTQPTDPCHNMLASAVIAVLPVSVIFWALVLRKM
jgi:lactate permease